MRLWSLHPEYLDTKGLLAVWREGLLAKKVLEGHTKGYKNHPQLERFKNTKDPLSYIHRYLFEIFEEAKKRGYHFDCTKIKKIKEPQKLPVTRGQIEFERVHLEGKLKMRDHERWKKVKVVNNLKIHPLFHLVEGKRESWEKIKET